MSRKRLRKTARDGTAAWLGCAAALLLGLAAAFLAHVHGSQMQALHDQAAQTRARLMAHSIAEHLAYATSAGIPLHQLVGVEEYFDRWHANHSEVMHIAVHDLQGQLLWRSRLTPQVSSTPASTGSADVEHAGAVQARVSLQVRDGSAQGRSRILALLAPAVLLFSALAYLGAHFACAQGPWLRNHGVRMISRWAIRGEYRQLLVLPQPRQFDLRVQEVAHAMRSVHERMARMRLLIGSLRRTEPQQQRREYLDQVLQRAEGSDRFGDAGPTILRLVPVQVQSHWMALLVCLGAISPLTYALRSLDFSDRPGTPWLPALPAACLGLMGLAAALGYKFCARLRIAPVTALLLSLGALLLVPLALLLDSGLHPGWIAAWNGGFAGAALAACTRAQTHPDAHPGYLHAQPQMAGAALRAWWGSYLWLAPALGCCVQAALRPPWTLLALLLPAAAGLLFATRWDVAYSPWRVRMAPPRQLPRATPAWPIGALGLAAGLAGGALLLQLVVPGTPAWATMLQPCVLGLGLAMLWVGPRQTRPHRSSRWRWSVVALLTLAIQCAMLSSHSLLPLLPHPWQELLQVLPAFLLGLLLARGLAQAAHTPQEATSQMLLACAAPGAVLSALAGALDLAGWPLALAALMALPAVRAKGLHAS